MDSVFPRRKSARKLAAACLIASPLFSICSQAEAALFDFQAWVANNGEQGFTNAAPLTLTDSGLSLTARAFESPGNTNSHVYMDGVFNGIIGGMGVCSVLDGNNMCTPSSDDNVSIDGTNTEKLRWDFSLNITRITLELGDKDHFDFDSRKFEYKYGGGTWTTATTDASGFATLVAAAGSADKIRFRAFNGKAKHQYYIRNATITTVPVPAAAWLFASGLLGLLGIARQRG